MNRCLGYDNDGTAFDCPNPPGTPWTPVWCADCDERRKARITAQLEMLAEGLRPGPISEWTP